MTGNDAGSPATTGLGASVSTLTRLRHILDRRTKRRLAAAGLVSIVMAVLDTLAVSLVLPLVNSLTGGASGAAGRLQPLLDLLGAGDGRDLQLRLLVVVVSLFVLKDLGALAFAWWVGGFVFRERALMSARMVDRILHAPHAATSSRSAADLLQVAETSVTQVCNTLLLGLVNAAVSAFSIALIAVALVTIGPFVTIALVLYLGILALVFQRFAKPVAVRAGEAAAASSREGHRTALAAFGGMKEIRLRGAQERFVEPFLVSQVRGARAQRASTFLGAAPRYLFEVFFIIAVGVVMVLTGDGASSQVVGLIALFVAAGFRILPAITGLISNINLVRFGSDYVRILHDEMSRLPPPPSTGSDAVAPGPDIRLQGQVELEDVWFRFPGTTSDILRGINLQVPRGHTVALVGGSGAGKTTLVDVLIGLHQPTRGSVSVDGTDITSNLRSWQQSVGYVAQETFLLEASLAENVVFDLSPGQIDRSRVERALADAELLDLARTLPEGLDTQVGERGSRLSGGQRQRVGIARALYRGCDLLVLDEATSALDNETEHRISQTIARLGGRVTVVMIAHRLSSIRKADAIIYLDRGTVSAHGSYDELYTLSPGFARLVDLGAT